MPIFLGFASVLALCRAHDSRAPGLTPCVRRTGDSPPPANTRGVRGTAADAKAVCLRGLCKGEEPEGGTERMSRTVPGSPKLTGRRAQASSRRASTTWAPAPHSTSTACPSAAGQVTAGGRPRAVHRPPRAERLGRLAHTAAFRSGGRRKRGERPRLGAWEGSPSNSRRTLRRRPGRGPHGPRGPRGPRGGIPAREGGSVSSRRWCCLLPDCAENLYEKGRVGGWWGLSYPANCALSIPRALIAPYASERGAEGEMPDAQQEITNAARGCSWCRPPTTKRDMGFRGASLTKFPGSLARTRSRLKTHAARTNAHHLAAGRTVVGPYLAGGLRGGLGSELGLLHLRPSELRVTRNPKRPVCRDQTEKKKQALIGVRSQR
jgi:hypothetical protein